MELIVVERVFDSPFDPDEFKAQAMRGAWCLRAHDVRHIETILSKDRLRTFCLYEAPDAEAVRSAQRQMGLPLTRVWSAERRTSSSPESRSSESSPK